MQRVVARRRLDRIAHHVQVMLLTLLTCGSCRCYHTYIVATRDVRVDRLGVLATPTTAAIRRAASRRVSGHRAPSVGLKRARHRRGHRA